MGGFNTHGSFVLKTFLVTLWCFNIVSGAPGLRLVGRVGAVVAAATPARARVPARGLALVKLLLDHVLLQPAQALRDE